MLYKLCINLINRSYINNLKKKTTRKPTLHNVDSQKSTFIKSISICVVFFKFIGAYAF